MLKEKTLLYMGKKSVMLALINSSTSACRHLSKQLFQKSGLNISY